MKRDLASILFQHGAEQGYQPGDEEAYRAAGALADRFDAPTIIALTDALSYLRSMGGQLFLVTLRDRVDALGNPIAEDGSGGTWRTLGLHIEYETRDAKIALAKPPEEIFGVEVMDFGKPPVRIEIDAPAAREAPEGEDDLRDQIEAEAGALLDEDEPVALSD